MRVISCLHAGNAPRTTSGLLPVPLRLRRGGAFFVWDVSRSRPPHRTPAARYGRCGRTPIDGRDAASSGGARRSPRQRAGVLAHARDRKTQNEAERRTLEKDVAAVRSRRSEFLDQTIEVKTNKEFHALQHEIQTAEQEIARLEDLILENMVAADDVAQRSPWKPR